MGEPLRNAHEPDCTTWALQIEQGSFETTTALELAKKLTRQGVDAIALACTHYLYLKADMQAAVGSRATIFDPLAAVTRQFDRMLQDAARPL